MDCLACSKLGGGGRGVLKIFLKGGYFVLVFITNIWGETHAHIDPTPRESICVRNTLSNLTILYFCILNQFQRVDLNCHTVLRKLYVRTNHTNTFY